MAKPASRPFSRYATKASELLGLMIRNARLQRGFTAADIAERAGISRGLVQRIERGDMGCSIGAVFELAALNGVPLFEADPTTLARYLSNERDKMALLPKRAPPSAKSVKDDF